MIENFWDVHEHKNELKISDEYTIYHSEHGQLCYCERHYDVLLFYPLRFKSKSDTQKWIDSGTIAELQESLMILSIGFSKFSLCENKY